MGVLCKLILYLSCAVRIESPPWLASCDHHLFPRISSVLSLISPCFWTFLGQMRLLSLSSPPTRPVRTYMRISLYPPTPGLLHLLFFKDTYICAPFSSSFRLLLVFLLSFGRFSLPTYMKFIDESATSPRPLGESRCKYVPIPFSSLKRPLTETIGRALQSSKNTNLFRLSVATQCLVCGRLFIILPAEIDIYFSS